MHRKGHTVWNDEKADNGLSSATCDLWPLTAGNEQEVN